MTLRSSSRLASLVGASVCVAAIATAGCERKAVETVETNAAVPVVVGIAKIDTLQAVISTTGLVTVAPGAELKIVAAEALLPVPPKLLQPSVADTGSR